MLQETYTYLMNKITFPVYQHYMQTHNVYRMCLYIYEWNEPFYMFNYERRNFTELV